MKYMKVVERVVARANYTGPLRQSVIRLEEMSERFEQHWANWKEREWKKAGEDEKLFYERMEQQFSLKMKDAFGFDHHEMIEVLKEESAFWEFCRKHHDFDQFLMEYFSCGAVSVQSSDVAYCIMFVHSMNFVTQAGPSLGYNVVKVGAMLRRVAEEDLMDAVNSGEKANAMLLEMKRDHKGTNVDLKMRLRRKLADAEDWIYMHNVMRDRSMLNKPRETGKEPFWL